MLSPSATNLGGGDPRKHKDSVYAFGRYIDALLWAHRLGWDEDIPTVYIITFQDSPKGWVQDEHFENSGHWFYKETIITPSQFENIELWDKHQMKCAGMDIDYKGIIHKRLD